MKTVQDIGNLYNEVREIITTARQNAVRSVDFSRVQMYWKIGHRIQEEEQKGKERADYGSYLLKNLAKKLEPEYGSGFYIVNCSFVANSIVCIQLRTHCVHNSIGLNTDC